MAMSEEQKAELEKVDKRIKFLTNLRLGIMFIALFDVLIFQDFCRGFYFYMILFLLLPILPYFPFSPCGHFLSSVPALFHNAVVLSH